MKQLRALALLIVVLTVLPMSAAFAADPAAELVPGGSYSWDGTQSPAVNTNYHNNHDTGVAEVDAVVRSVQPAGTCSSSATTYCETKLIKFTNPVPVSDADGRVSRAATVNITEALGDVDLEIFESDANGTKGGEVGQSAGPNTSNTTLDETLTIQVVTTRPTLAKPTQPDVPSKYFLVNIVYYSAAGYSGSVSF